MSRTVIQATHRRIGNSLRGFGLWAFLITALAILPMPAAAQRAGWKIDILRQTFDISTAEQVDVALGDIHQGCARRDCIPSIDQPRFVSPEAIRGLQSDDLVLGLVRGGEARAYPAFIMNRHEIVNDTLDGLPIAVTYCPLCGSGVAFERSVAGDLLAFGVSGLLFNSDLIMYDRDSKSLWQQITGKAIAGPRRGEELRRVELSMVTWAEWLNAHPETRVLAGERGVRYTNKRPYGDYDSSEQLMFPANSAAARLLHPKQVVFGAHLADGQAIAVSERALKSQPQLDVIINGATVSWARLPDGHVRVSSNGAGETVFAHRMFWFAWYSFNPGTAIWDTDSDR